MVEDCDNSVPESGPSVLVSTHKPTLFRNFQRGALAAPLMDVWCAITGQARSDREYWRDLILAPRYRDEQGQKFAIGRQK